MNLTWLFAWAVFTFLISAILTVMAQFFSFRIAVFVALAGIAVLLIDARR